MGVSWVASLYLPEIKSSEVDNVVNIFTYIK